MHQDKLVVNSPCQIFVTTEGQWIDAVVFAIGVGAGASASDSGRRWVDVTGGDEIKAQ